MIPPIIRIGIDIGFGDVKAVFSKVEDSGLETDLIRFPSAIARIKNKAIAGLDDANIEYEFESRMYLVGKDAFASANIIPTRDIDYILEFSPLLVFRALEFISERYHLPMDSIRSATEVCLGLPLAYFKSKKIPLAERLTHFEVLGYEVELQRLAVQAQGQGILLDFLLDDHCRANRKWVESDILIIDIGFNTIDILCVHEGRSNSEWSDMLEGVGTCRICRQLEIELKKMGIDLPEQAVKNVLATRNVSIYGEVFDLSDIVDPLVRDYADFLYREIRSRFSDVLKNSKKLIIAGGGAHYVVDFLRQRFPEEFLHVPFDPEFSNARGYYKYLKGVKNG